MEQVSMDTFTGYIRRRYILVRRYNKRLVYFAGYGRIYPHKPKRIWESYEFGEAVWFLSKEAAHLFAVEHQFWGDGSTWLVWSVHFATLYLHNERRRSEKRPPATNRGVTLSNSQQEPLL